MRSNTVRNDHVTICSIGEQILIGEKIKAILRNKYETKSFSPEYKEIKTGELNLMINWFVDHSRNDVINFMNGPSLQIQASIQEEISNVIVIKLYQIHGGLISLINKYFKDKLPNEKKVSSRRVEMITGKIIEARNVNVDSNFISVVAEPALEVGVDLIKEKLELMSESFFVAEKNEPNEPNEQDKITKYIKRYRSSFNLFLTHASLFERKYKTSHLSDLHNLFSYDDPVNGYIQVLRCKDKNIAFSIEKAIRWQLNYYKEDSLISRSGNLVVVDCSIDREIKKEKSTGGSFCFAPNEEVSFEEMQDRLHRISYLPKNPEIKQKEDCFLVKYPTAGKAERVHSLISRMGWVSKYQDNKLLIIVGPNPSLSFIEEEVKNKEIKIEKKKEPEFSLVESHAVKEKEVLPESLLLPNLVLEPIKISLVGELKKANFNYQKSLYFSGSQSEALEKLQYIHLNQEVFLTFSSDNQQKISNVLQKYWLKEHFEEYVMSIVDFLETEI